MTGNDARFCKALVPTHVEEISACAESRVVNRLGRPVSQRPPFDESEQMIHGVEFGTGSRQQPDLNVEFGSALETILSCVRSATVFKQHDVPSFPMAADHRQEVLVREGIPDVRDQKHDVPSHDVDRPVHDAFGAIARDRDAHLLAAPPVAAVQWWRFRNDDLVEHQDDGVIPAPEPAFEPPFACLQNQSRCAKVWRGSFQPIPSRAMARLTLRLEIAM